MMLSGQQRNLLICRFPFAAYGRNDGTLFFQCSKSLIHFLTVGTQCLGHVACGNRLASLAHSSNYAVNDQDFRYVVVHEFERHGWQVNDIYLGNPMRHDEKYLLINQGFAGKQWLMPFFNRQNNDDLILAIQSAGVERGRNGFRKNKSMEKNPESEEDLLEHRTDGTDAFDTLYIGCEKFPQHDTYPISMGGVM